MSGNEGDLSSAHQVEKLRRILYAVVPEPFIQRGMLGDIQVGISRKQSYQALYPGKHMLGIAFFIFFLSVIYYIVKHNHHVFSQAESIVLRSHVLAVRSCRCYISLDVLLVVMIACDRIERHARAHDFLLETLLIRKRIPAYVTQGQTYRHDFLRQSFRSLGKVLKRFACEFGEMTFVLCLRIGYGQQRPVAASLGFLKVKNELVLSLCPPIELRDTG